VSGSELLAVAFGNEVRIISIGGTSASLMRDAPFFDGVDGADLIALGRTLLVRAYAESSPSSGMRLAVVRTDGTVLWTQSYAVSFAGGTDRSALNWGLSLGDDGTAFLDDRDAQDFHIETAGNLAASLPGYFPIGGARHGFMPVRGAWSSAALGVVTTGWWKIGPDQSVVGLEQVSTEQTRDDTDPIWFADRLLRLRRSDVVALRVEGPSETSELVLPGATAGARIAAAGDGVLRYEDERWLLVDSGAAGRVFRVDVRALAVERIEVVAPSGYRPFQPCGDAAGAAPDLKIDTEGHIFSVFRTDDHVAVFMTTDGAAWSQVGGSYTGIGTLDVVAERGTYVITGSAAAYCWAQGPKWSSPATAEFSGDATQLVRPSASARLTLPDPPLGTAKPGYVLSCSGRYAARWDVDAATHVSTMNVLDVETGSVKAVATDAVGTHSALPVWLCEP
jgi:hypothetical protein